MKPSDIGSEQQEYTSKGQSVPNARLKLVIQVFRERRSHGPSFGSENSATGLSLQVRNNLIAKDGTAKGVQSDWFASSRGEDIHFSKIGITKRSFSSESTCRMLLSS